MATITLSPDAILESTGWASGQLSYIQENISLSDGNFYIPNANASTVLRVSFPTPTQPSTLTTTTNSQTFQVRIRATNAQATASAQIQLYKNGVLVSSGSDTVINDASVTGSVISYTWTPTANDSGADIECRVVVTGDTSGSGSSRGSLEIGAIAWVSNYTPTAEATLNTNWNVPDNIFPFDTSAWKRVEIKAHVSSIDGSSCKLVIEYSKTDSTLATYTTQTSIALSSGATWTETISGTHTDGQWIYYRLYVTNTTGTLRSNKTPIRRFQYRTTGGSYAPDGTAFMQQGDPNIHYRMIDVSKWQEDQVEPPTQPIDWQAVKDDGVLHTYIRVWGSDSVPDPKYKKFVTDSRAVGIKSGGYWYACINVPMSLQQARDDATYYAQLLQEGWGTGNYGDLIPILDLEDNSSVRTAGNRNIDLTVEEMLQWANEFRNHFESITGRTLGLYTGDYFVRDLRNNFNHDDATGLPVSGTSGNILSDMPLWIQGYINFPRYQGYVMPSCGGWTKWYMFQWSDTTYQTGISANYTDQNWSEPIEYWMPPTDVTGVVADGTGNDITVTWNANTEVDIVGYDIYLNGTLHGSVDETTTTYTITGAGAGNHSVGVRAKDEFGDDSLVTTAVTYSIVSNGTPPTVTIVSVDRLVISDEPDVDKAHITFKFDMDTKRYTVNVNGVDWQTGLIAHSGGGKSVADLSSETVLNLASQTVQQISIIVAGMEIVAEIDYTELAEGDNRVNIYGESIDGTWTPYDTGVDTTPPEDVTNLALGSVTYESIEAFWDASVSTDVQDYIIYVRNDEVTTTFTQVGETVNTTFIVGGLTPLTVYTVKVVARDVDGNVSNGVEISTTTADFR